MTTPQQRRRDLKVAAACGVLVVTMGGLAFAAVPLYNWFCRTTGFAGTTQVATAAPGHVLDRKIEVRFDANVTGGLPWRFEPDQTAVLAARRAAVQMGGTVELVRDPKEAAREANVLYTDVWTSMGQEEEAERRRADLAGYGIDAELVATAAPDAIVMHCLPAHYGEEITEDVLYGPRSAVWDEAENRLHAQKALLALVVR